MPFIYLNYIYSTIFNILLIFISIYNAPYQLYNHFAIIMEGNNMSFLKSLFGSKKDEQRNSVQPQTDSISRHNASDRAIFSQRLHPKTGIV